MFQLEIILDIKLNSHRQGVHNIITFTIAVFQYTNRLISQTKQQAF
jgi:hypothetical protein